MPRIRRATATVMIEEDTANEIAAVALTNNDGNPREVIGGILSVFAGNDTLAATSGIQAVMSTQAFTTETRQQGLDLRGTSTEQRRNAGEAREGPFAVAQVSGRDSKEDGKQVEFNFGADDAYIPWPDGAQMHLACIGLDGDDNGGRAHAIWYYREGGGSL